jgi:hypothetical protein
MEEYSGPDEEAEESQLKKKANDDDLLAIVNGFRGLLREHGST